VIAAMPRILRLVFIAGAILMAAVAPSYARTILAATPISRMDLPWWRERFEAKQVALHAHPPALIFLGDSITQDWERHGPPPWMDFAPIWQRFYGDRNAVNLGFVGDTTANLLWRILHGETDGIAPKVAVVLIGANNLGRLHWSADDTVQGIDTIVSTLLRRLPNTRLLVLGVLPSDRSSWATSTTTEINRMLADRYGHADNVTFLDVSHVFMRDGRLDRDLFYDPKETPPGAPLHPTAQGQERMAEAIEPTLAKLLGDQVHH
jgi:lysophospholipase L1-like esterase